MRRFMTLSLLAAAGICFSLSAQEPADSNANQDQQKPKYVPKDRIISLEHKVSNERIEKIQALLQKYYEARKNFENSAVISDIKQDISAFVPVVPSEKADMRNLIAIKDSLQGEVDKKFADAEKLKKNAEAEAEKKFPMVQNGQEIKVYFKRGRSTYSAKGRFYGYGLGGKSIKINSRTIPFFDLVPESKAMFDKKINDELRAEYVKDKLRIYMRQRLNYSEKLFAQEYAKIRQANEKRGYIYLNGNWVTAETILKQMLPEQIRLTKERAEKERLEKEAKEKARREAGGKPEDEQKKNDDDDDE